MRDAADAAKQELAKVTHRHLARPGPLRRARRPRRGRRGRRRPATTSTRRCATSAGPASTGTTPTRARVRALQEELVGIGQDFDRNIRSDTRTVALAPDRARRPARRLRAGPPGRRRRAGPDHHRLPGLRPVPDLRDRRRRPRAAVARCSGSAVIRPTSTCCGRMLGAPARARHPARLPELGRVRDRGQDDRHARRTSPTSSPGIADAAADRARARLRRAAGPQAGRRPGRRPRSTRGTRPTSTTGSRPSSSPSTPRRCGPTSSTARVKAGLMGLVERLFGVRFAARTDVPVWHPEVECYDVLSSADGALLGRIFLDMHPRAGQVQPRRDVRHDQRQGRAYGWPSARWSATCPGPGAEPALLQHSDVEHVLPRVRSPDPPRLRRRHPVGRHQRHRHRVGLRRGAVAAARGVDPGRRRRWPPSPCTTRPASRCRPSWWRSCGRPTSSARACSCGSRCSTPR